MAEHRLVGLCGSLRKGSYNNMLMQEAARLFDPAEFVAGDLALPLYDGDVEDAGMPDKVVTLADQIRNADAIVISSPEYNKGVSGVMKNALDWISRVEGRVMAGKPVAILSATAGRTGGETAQFMLRACLNSFQCRVLTAPGVMVASASGQFDDAGALTTESYQKALAGLMSELKGSIA